MPAAATHVASRSSGPRVAQPRFLAPVATRPTCSALPAPVEATRPLTSPSSIWYAPLRPSPCRRGSASPPSHNSSASAPPPEQALHCPVAPRRTLPTTVSSHPVWAPDAHACHAAASRPVPERRGPLLLDAPPTPSRIAAIPSKVDLAPDRGTAALPASRRLPPRKVHGLHEPALLQRAPAPTLAHEGGCLAPEESTTGPAAGPPTVALRSHTVWPRPSPLHPPAPRTISTPDASRPPASPEPWPTPRAPAPHGTANEARGSTHPHMEPAPAAGGTVPAAHGGHSASVRGRLPGARPPIGDGIGRNAIGWPAPCGSREPGHSRWTRARRS